MIENVLVTPFEYDYLMAQKNDVQITHMNEMISYGYFKSLEKYFDIDAEGRKFVSIGTIKNCEFIIMPSNMEEIVNEIRKYAQMDLYTVDKVWCLHLFEPDVAANDIDISCMWEDDARTAIEVLKKGLDYLLEVEEERRTDE